MKNDREEHIFDPYSTDDPNVGEVHYGEVDSGNGASSRSHGPGDDPSRTMASENGPHFASDADAAQKSGGRNVRSTRPVQPSRSACDAHEDRPVQVPRSAQPPQHSVSQGHRASVELDSVVGQEMSPEQLRRRVQGKTRRAGVRLNVGLLLTVLVFVLVVGACVLYLTMCLGESAAPAPAQTTAAPLATLPDQTPAASDDFDTVSIQNTRLYEGDLILVNYEHEYKFPTDSDTVSVYNFKTKSYKVRDTLTALSKAVILRFNALMDDFAAATGCADMLVNSGYRDYAFQNEIYTERVQTEGAEQAAKFVALPGYSEHHTALAMDLSVYLADGSSVPVADYEPCDWFEEHAPEYGFVLRYPSEKADITRISYEAWHYRYVGVPHAAIMTGSGLCLEEYTDFLRQYQCPEKYLVVRQGTPAESIGIPDDAEYVIYSVPASQGEATDVPVPKGIEYTISGNNVDGFVVTARK